MTVGDHRPPGHRRIQGRRHENHLGVALPQRVEQPVRRQRAGVPALGRPRPPRPDHRRPRHQRHRVPVEQLGQPLPHVAHGRPDGQVQHQLDRPVALDLEQPLRVVAGDRRRRVEPLQIERQPDLEVEAADPVQQPGQVVRGARLARGPRGRRTGPARCVRTSRDRAGTSRPRPPRRTRPDCSMAARSCPAKAGAVASKITGIGAGSDARSSACSRAAAASRPSPQVHSIQGEWYASPRASTTSPGTSRSPPPRYVRPPAVSTACVTAPLNATCACQTSPRRYPAPASAATTWLGRPATDGTANAPVPQRDRPQRLGIQLEGVGGVLPGGQQQAEPVQPVALGRPVGQPGPAADDPGGGQLDGDVEAQPTGRALRGHDDGVRPLLRQTRGQLGPADQPGLHLGEGRSGAVTVVAADQAGAFSPAAARDDRVRQRLGRQQRGQRSGRLRPVERAEIGAPVPNHRQAGARDLEQQTDAARPEMDPAGLTLTPGLPDRGPGADGVGVEHERPPRAFQFSVTVSHSRDNILTPRRRRKSILR